MKKYTRIKHEVFENIFARGLLSKREIQIASVIIRESWGWDKGTSNWTKKKLTNKGIGLKTGLDKAVVSKILRLMIQQRKILIQDGKYSFNEHCDRWQKLTKGQLSKPKKVDKRSTKSRQKVNFELTKGQLLVDKTSTFDGLKIDITAISMKDLRALLKLPKESIKEIFKEIFKESIHTLHQFYEEKIQRKLKIFGSTRQNTIKARLENFSLNELKLVVENISNSDWHMGRDKKTQGKSYNDFELLFRNDTQVEKYLNLRQDQKFSGIKEWLLEKEIEDAKGG